MSEEWRMVDIGSVCEKLLANNRQLRAENERLRSGTYQPLPNGYNTGRIGNYEIQIGLDSGKLYIFNIRKNRTCWEIDLPDDMKVCKWQEGANNE